jgi:hypothetical protein
MVSVVRRYWALERAMIAEKGGCCNVAFPGLVVSIDRGNRTHDSRSRRLVGELENVTMFSIDPKGTETVL